MEKVDVKNYDGPELTAEQSRLTWVEAQKRGQALIRQYQLAVELDLVEESEN